jgi:hypothetical protein
LSPPWMLVAQALLARSILAASRLERLGEAGFGGFWRLQRS